MENIKDTSTTTSSGDEKVLGKRFNLWTLFVYSFPMIFTLLVIATYQTVDGFFITKYCGELAIAATNLYAPVLGVLVAIGIMLGTGGNAIIVKLRAEDNKEKADNVFTQVVCLALVLGVIVTIVGLVFAQPIMRFLGASDINIVYLSPYYYAMTSGSIVIILQTLYGVFLPGEGRSVIAAVLIVVGGVVNIVLDVVFMKFLGSGIVGAGIATVLGYLVTVVYAIYYIFIGKKSINKIKFGKLDVRSIGRACTNGVSELISNLSAGITALCLNHLMFSFRQEYGVSALSTVLYFQFIIISIFMGFSFAIEPVFSYHFGKQNIKERQRVFRLSIALIAIISAIVVAVMAIFGRNIVGFFFTEDTDIFNITLYGLNLSIPACFFAGVNTFICGMFTAFSNGKVSAILSIFRTVIFNLALIFGLSFLFGEFGLWISWFICEVVSAIFSLVFLIINNKKYHYFK